MIFIVEIMSVRDDILKKTLNKLVKSTVQKDPAFRDIYKAEVFFMFQSPIKTAMCDYVYGLRIIPETEYVDRALISAKLQKKITNTLSQISNKTFCCTEVSFE
jgi:hypothetical protein